MHRRRVRNSMFQDIHKQAKKKLSSSLSSFECSACNYIDTIKTFFYFKHTNFQQGTISATCCLVRLSTESTLNTEAHTRSAYKFFIVYTKDKKLLY